MSNFFLGPNFREKLNMGSVNPINLNIANEQEEIKIEQTQEQVENKKVKGKQDGKEQGHDKSV